MTWRETMTMGAKAKRRRRILAQMTKTNAAGILSRKSVRTVRRYRECRPVQWQGRTGFRAQAVQGS